MASSFQWHVNNTFDPFNQVFTVLGPDGQTPVLVPLASTLELQVESVIAGISQGVQTGAAGLLFLALFLVTKADKRRSLVFILNALALLLVVLRGIFICIDLNGPFRNWYRVQTYYYTNTSTSQNISICAQLIQFLLISVLEMSLVFQVRIVCCTMDPQWRYLVNAFNIFVALLEIGASFASTIVVIDWNILGVQTETEVQFQQMTRLVKASNILLVASIGFSAAIFCAKLAFAIRSRRSMGMTQFGPMQIIFIMGCQTMCIPFVFLLIAFFGIPKSQLQSIVPTVVACTLPLSGMWATANTTNVHIANPSPHTRDLIRIGGSNSVIRKTDKVSNNTTTTATTTSDTLIDEDITPTRVSPSRSTQLGLDSRPDLEMQKLSEGGVHVDRTYTVRSD